MLPEELVSLVNDVIAKRCEMQNIEIKRASGGTPQRLYDTLSSFSNQRAGGIIIFGIDESENYAITGVYNPQDLQVKVTEQANQMQPIVRPLFTVANIEGKLVVSAEISECDVFEKPCYYKGAGKIRGSYIRVGEADLPMTEYEIYSYDAFKRKIQDELRPIPQGIGGTLDKTELSLFLAKTRKQKPNLAGLTDEQIMTLNGLIVDTQPTIAGLMLFGMYSQGNFPQLCVTAVVVPGYEIGNIDEDGARFIDNKRIEGTIPQMLEGAMSFVQRNMRIKTIINESGKRSDKPEYPMKAVREIILNALIHRDYSINTENSPIRIMFYSDRLEVENPGGLYGRLTIDDLGKVGADTRNPYIANALEIMIDTENRFSGIPTIRNEMAKAGLIKPVFSNSRGVFKVVLYNGNKTYESFRNQKLNEEDDIAYETGVMDGIDETLDLQDKILIFCKTPKTRDEIAKRFDFEAVSYMMTRYVQPLIDEGKLKMTIPEKPKSKYQKYVVDGEC